MIQYELVNGATIEGLDIRMRPAMIGAGAWRKAHGFPTLIITCGLNGEHSTGSLHPDGLALDFRTRDTDDGGQAFADDLRNYLGDDFDVILHSTHLHVEYDPK